MQVVAANDQGPSPKIGTIVRLLRREPIETVNEGVVEEHEIYLVRWPLDDGGEAEAEAPGVNLRALPTPGRHGGTSE